MDEKIAWLNWSKCEHKWILRLWIDEDEEWQYSKFWTVKDINPETELGYISEEILCELKSLYELGYTIEF